MLKITRLFQPRNPVFWLMLVLNALSLLLAWVVDNRKLNGTGMLIMLVLALGNALWGVYLAWRLMRVSSAAKEALNMSHVARDPPDSGGLRR